MTVLKCHNCGREVAAPDTLPKEFVCSVCGAVNVTPPASMTGSEVLGCIPPTSFEWKLPAGRMGNPIQGYTYITAQGSHMTKKEYMDAFGIDPDIALEYMRSGAAAKERDDDYDIGGKK